MSSKGNRNFRKKRDADDSEDDDLNIVIPVKQGKPTGTPFMQASSSTATSRKYNFDNVDDSSFMDDSEPVNSTTFPATVKSVSNVVKAKSTFPVSSSLKPSTIDNKIPPSSTLEHSSIRNAEPPSFMEEEKSLISNDNQMTYGMNLSASEIAKMKASRASARSNITGKPASRISFLRPDDIDSGKLKSGDEIGYVGKHSRRIPSNIPIDDHMDDVTSSNWEDDIIRRGSKINVPSVQKDEIEQIQNASSHGPSPKSTSQPPDLDLFGPSVSETSLSSLAKIENSLRSVYNRIVEDIKSSSSIYDQAAADYEKIQKELSMLVSSHDTNSVAFDFFQPLRVLIAQICRFLEKFRPLIESSERACSDSVAEYTRNMITSSQNECFSYVFYLLKNNVDVEIFGNPNFSAGNENSSFSSKVFRSSSDLSTVVEWCSSVLATFDSEISTQMGVEKASPSLRVSDQANDELIASFIKKMSNASAPMIIKDSKLTLGTVWSTFPPTTFTLEEFFSIPPAPGLPTERLTFHAQLSTDAPALFTTDPSESPSLSFLLEELTKWKCHPQLSKSYATAHASLALGSLLSPLVDAQLQVWHPGAPWGRELHTFPFFTSLWSFGEAGPTAVRVGDDELLRQLVLGVTAAGATRSFGRGLDCTLPQSTARSLSAFDDVLTFEPPTSTVNELAAAVVSSLSRSFATLFVAVPLPRAGLVRSTEDIASDTNIHGCVRGLLRALSLQHALGRWAAVLPEPFAREAQGLARRNLVQLVQPALASLVSFVLGQGSQSIEGVHFLGNLYALFLSANLDVVGAPFLSLNGQERAQNTHGALMCPPGILASLKVLLQIAAHHQLQSAWITALSIVG